MFFIQTIRTTNHFSIGTIYINFAEIFKSINKFSVYTMRLCSWLWQCQMVTPPIPKLALSPPSSSPPQLPSKPPQLPSHQSQLTRVWMEIFIKKNKKSCKLIIVMTHVCIQCCVHVRLWRLDWNRYWPYWGDGVFWYRRRW